MARRGGSRGQFISIDSKQLKNAEVSLRNLKTSIEAGPDVAVSASGRYFQKMQRQAAYSLQEVRNYIRYVATTPTGLERGKNPGRYESGALHNAFVGTKGSGVTRIGTRKVRFYFEMGWLRGMPNYTLFQEYGTRNGIKAMNALMRARQEITWNILEESTNSLDALAKDIAGNWLGSIKGTKARGAIALKNDIWRSVLSTRLDGED